MRGPAAGPTGRGAVLALCAVQVVDVQGATVVLTALPAMLRGVQAPPSAATAVLTGYPVMFGALLMLGARLGDRWGHRRLLLSGLTAFGAASVLGAAAPAVEVLVAARCLQGAAAAASVPAALRLLTAAAPDEAGRRRALAAWSAAGAAAGTSGLLLGGVLTDLLGWRSVFGVQVPLAVVLGLAVRRLAPVVPPQRTGSLDVAGAVLLTGAVGALVLGGSLLESPSARAEGALALLAGTVLAATFVAIERRVDHPLVPAGAARSRALRTGSAVSFLNTATTGTVVLASLHLQDEHGFGPTVTGVLLLPFSLCVVVGAALAPRLLRGAPVRVVAGTGLAGIAAGDAGLLAAPQLLGVLPVAVAVCGVGIGVSSVAATTLGTSVPPELAGTAAGALNTAAQLGTALGVAALLLVASASASSALPLAGPPLAWALAALAAAVPAGLLLVSGARRARTGPAT